MKGRRGQVWILLGVFLILVAIGIVALIYVSSRSNVIYVSEAELLPPPIPIQNVSTVSTVSTVKVANWNLQIFGVTKASKPEILQFYYNKLRAYDIIFVQEIRDSSNTSFNKLCEMFEGYKCDISSRDGRTDSKEQVGIIYKNNTGLISYYTQADPNDVWERSPVIAVFSNGIHIYNAHLKPDDVKNELHAFENFIAYAGPVMILGDFNADCDYYNPSTDNAFDSWQWIINTDTTVSKNDCAYDRIIVNDYAKDRIKNSGVDSSGINTTYSDHYIVWSEIVWQN